MNSRTRNRGITAQMQARAAERLELCPYSQRVDDAISALERRAARALKLARDAENGVTQMKRPRAIAVAGAVDRDERRSPR